MAAPWWIGAMRPAGLPGSLWGGRESESGRRSSHHIAARADGRRAQSPASACEAPAAQSRSEASHNLTDWPTRAREAGRAAPAGGGRPAAGPRLRREPPRRRTERIMATDRKNNNYKKRCCCCCCCGGGWFSGGGGGGGAAAAEVALVAEEQEGAAQQLRPRLAQRECLPCAGAATVNVRTQEAIEVILAASPGEKASPAPAPGRTRARATGRAS